MRGLVGDLQELSKISRTYDQQKDIPSDERREFMNMLKLEEQRIAREVLRLENAAREIDAEMTRQ